MKLLIYILLSFIYLANNQFNDYKNYNYELKALIDSLNIEASSIYLFVDKSDYKLSVMSDSVIIKEYPVVFGGNPTDDKLQQGDECTPEGSFKVITKYPHKSWTYFIWFDYPNNGSWKKHNKAKAEGKITQNAKIGGELGIHGVPEGFDSAINLKTNWTLGCISLKNKDIKEIYPIIRKEMLIFIQK